MCRHLIIRLSLYEERDWVVFAGGKNINAARQPVMVEHNGNRLVFIGCNPAGPEMVWATEYRSGVADLRPGLDGNLGDGIACGWCICQWLLFNIMNPMAWCRV